MSTQLAQRETGPMALTAPERAIAHEALDKLIDSGIGGSTHDPNIAASFMELAMRKHILLSPALGAFRMRPGWEIAFTKLRVDTSKQARLVYKVNDDYSDDAREWSDGTLLAFHKPLLYIIRTHLGINMTDIVRIDDGKKQYCYEFKVFAEYLGVDGQIKTLVDVGGLDLSEGSDGAQKVLNEARGNNPEEKRRNGEKSLAKKRAKVMQFASTNAEERTIQSYGFRGSYTKAELDNKFIVCVKPLFTGYHPDPEIQKMLVAQMLGDQKQATAMLYGLGSGPSTSEPSPGLSPQITSGNMAEHAFDDDREENENRQTKTTATATATTAIKSEPYVLKSGKYAGKVVEALPDSSLSMLTGYYDHLAALSVKDEGQLADIQSDRAALLAEVDSRKAEAAQESQGEPQGELKL